MSKYRVAKYLSPIGRGLLIAKPHQEDWKEFYSKFIPHCESTKRTYYKEQLSY